MRMFGADVLVKIQTILSSSLGTELTTIASERSITIPAVNNILIGNSERQFPECIITLGNSNVKNDENLTMDIDKTPEEYPIEVVIVYKDLTQQPGTHRYDDKIRQECYIEALQKVLHGYSDEDVDYMIVTSCIRDSAYTEQKEWLKVVGVAVLLKTT